MTTRPVTLSEAQRFARTQGEASTTTERDLQDTYLLAAIDAVEQYTCLNLISRSVTATFLYRSLPLLLPQGPHLASGAPTSVTSRYQGADTAETAGDFWIQAGRSPVLFLTEDGDWTADDIDEVEVVYPAGYGDTPEDVPAGLRLAVLQLFLFAYDNRIPVSVGKIVSIIPGLAETLALLTPYRKMVL